MKKVFIITMAFMAIIVTGILATAGLSGLLGAMGLIDLDGAYILGLILGKVIWFVGIVAVAVMVVNFYPKKD